MDIILEGLVTLVHDLLLTAMVIQGLISIVREAISARKS